MASKARARSTWAAGALSERLRRVKAIRSSGVSGRRGSFWRRDMVYLDARGSPATIPNLTANDPLAGRGRKYLQSSSEGARVAFAAEGAPGNERLADHLIARQRP